MNTNKVEVDTSIHLQAIINKKMGKYSKGIDKQSLRSTTKNKTNIIDVIL